MTDVKKIISNRVAPINDLFQIDFWMGDYFVTRDRRMFGAVELYGYDADALGAEEHFSMARLADSIYSQIHNDVSVTQYYINHTDAKVSLSHRESAYNDRLSTSRRNFLNSQPLTEGRLYQFFEIPLNDDLNSMSFISLVKNLAGAISDPVHRRALKRKLSYRESTVLFKKDIQDKIDILDEVVETVLSRWSMMIEGISLKRTDIVSVLGYLSNFRSESLIKKTEVPERDGGSYLVDGNVSAVVVGGQTALKFDGGRSRYAQVCSVTSLGENPMPGFWFLSSQSIGNKVGNYVICFRSTRMSRLEQGMFFSSTEQDLARSNINLISMISGKEMDYAEKKSRMSEDHKNKFKELDEAKAQNSFWYYSNCYVLTHSNDINQLKKETLSVTNSLTNSGIKFVKETIGITQAYKSFFPTGRKIPTRRLVTNNQQNAVAGLYYKPVEGQRYVKDLQDEAQFIFQTPSGRPFHFSPFVEGRGLLIGIGPTRSGKTYFKNSIAAHFLKYGGELVDVDIDPGSEIIAKSLGDKGAIFNVDGMSGEGGFNFFSTYNKEDTSRFTAHLSQQLMRMLKANEEAGMRELADGEQEVLDNAIRATLLLPEKMHTLSHLMGHLPARLSSKFSRWIRSDSGDGKYSGFADCDKDAAGGLDATHKVFNFLRIKEDPHLLSLAYPEVFHRLVKKFEDPARRGVPKGLQIDECHFPLKDEYFAESLVTGVRSWNKYLVYLALWTQSPEELYALKSWEAVRSAAATLIFMADPQMTDEIYQKTFKVSVGECEAIRGLKPRKEAYIIQRDLGVSKKIILVNDPVMHAVATSHPKESPLRDRLVAEHGFDKGIEIAAKEIALLNANDDDLITKEDADLAKKQKDFYSS